MCYHLIDLSVVFCRGRHVRRREFVTFVGGAPASRPVAAQAQHSALPAIGFLNGASLEAMRDCLTVFKQSLAETRFTEGRDVARDYRWAGGRNYRLPEVASVEASTPRVLAASVSYSALMSEGPLVSAAHAQSDHARSGGSSTLFKLYRK
jgi:hypothetical protein